MNQLLKSREKIQLLWATELFKLFLACIAKRGIILPTHYEELKLELDTISEKTSKEEFDEETIKELNPLISNVNGQMKADQEPVKYAPFPYFSYAISENLQKGALGHLDMVQRTLNEAAKAYIIDWGTESHHFNEILKLYTRVEKGGSSKDAVAHLAEEIKKINAGLPQEFHFPEPDVSVYE